MQVLYDFSITTANFYCLMCYSGDPFVDATCMRCGVYPSVCLSRHGRSYAKARRGNCLLVIYDTIHATRSHKRTKDIVSRRVFESPNASRGRAPPGPAGELERSPKPSSHNRERSPTSKGKGGKGRGKERGKWRVSGGVAPSLSTAAVTCGCGWIAAELGRVQQISVDSCRRRVPAIDR